jgi:L-alanine-DL-glutamate epimerase-like enolase superfamily enzyme
MFRKLLDNNHIELRIAKNSTPALVEDPAPAVDPEELSRIAKSLVKYTAIAGVVVMSAGVVLKTLSEIAVIAAEANINSNKNED